MLAHNRNEKSLTARNGQALQGGFYVRYGATSKNGVVPFFDAADRSFGKLTFLRGRLFLYDGDHKKNDAG